MLEHLLHLAANGRWSMLRHWLQDFASRLPETARFEDPAERIERLKRLLAPRPELIDLLEIRLSAEWLLNSERISPWRQAIGGAVGWLPRAATNPGGRWMAVPVLLTGPGRRATVRYFVAGRLDTEHAVPLLPLWAEALCDPSAKEAMTTAANLSSAPGVVFHLFPLLTPGIGVAVCGPSLGLPLAMAFRQLVTNERPTLAVVATGALGEEGDLKAVSGLTAKGLAAWRHRFRHMVYPAANRPPKGIPDLESLPAADLDEALVSALLAGRNGPGSKRTFARMLVDAEAFVAHCPAVPADWIDLARRTGWMEDVRARVLADADRLADLARRIERLIDAGRYRQAASVASLVPPVVVETLPETHLESGFRWAVNCLALANRRGQVTEAAEWDRAGAALAQRAVDSGQPEGVAHYTNIAFVHRAQGRYHFSPDLPETLVTLETGLARLAEARRETGFAVDKGYGALCGTLAQHYGFCGPDWMDATERYIEKARRAFGGGAVPSRRNDWLRPLNYRCYARLDAGDRAGAHAALMAYLETECWDEIMQKVAALDRWQQALLARFLADAGTSAAMEKYLDWAAGTAPTVPAVHPWPLWGHNLGRMAQRVRGAETADRYYRGALARCQHAGMGPTVRVMALLPLAGLDALGRLEPAVADKEINAVRQAAAHLDPAHFRPVFEMDPASLLTLVRDNPRRLFPFSYR
jgi:hypothetical protein